MIEAMFLVWGLALVLAPFVWLARKVRRSGVGAQVMGPIDEVYNPGAFRSRHELQISEQRTVPRPSADDKPSP